MNLRHKHLGFWFVISLLFSLYIPLLIPSAKVQFFFPFLIVVFYQKNLITTLWISLSCGLCLDLFNNSHLVPLHGIAFALTSWLLYSQQKNFFADTLSTLPIMTYLYSFLFTLIYFIISNVYEEKLKLSIEWALTDLLIMPCIDVLYAVLFFMIPAFLFGRRQLKGKDYFLN